MKEMFIPKEYKKRMRKATLRVSVKNRNEYSDFDYLHKLCESDLSFLKKFHREYNNADFKHENPIIDIDKRKNEYDANNSRNRDLFGIKLVCGQLYEFNEDLEEELNKVRVNEYLKDL